MIYLKTEEELQKIKASSLLVSETLALMASLLEPGINTGASDSNPQQFVSIGNGTVLFRATDVTNGQELWVSDGTSAGTVLVKDINAGSNNSGPSNLVSLGNGTVLFSATDGVVNGTELWVSDGTSAGTVLVKDINAGTSGSSPFSLESEPKRGLALF